MSDTPITEGGDWPSPKYAQEIVFEGFPCFAVSPEEYSALYESHAKLERELAALKAGDPSCPMYGWSIETKAGKDLILVRDEVAAKAMVGIGYIARPVIEQSDAQAAIAQRDATIAELRAKLEGAERDAERYRWLREQHWGKASVSVVMQPKKAVKLGYDCPSLQRLDDAIDAAMKEGI